MAISLPTNRQSGQIVSASDINAIASTLNALFASTDFRETVEQIVGVLVTAAGGTYNSNGTGVGTITFPVGSVDQQAVKNTVGQMVTAAGGTYDGVGTITLPSTGGSGSVGTGAVGTAQLANGAVTDAKVTSVSADKLVDGTTYRVVTSGEKNKLANVPADTNGALQAKADTSSIAATNATFLAAVRAVVGVPTIVARTAAQGVPTAAQCAAAGYPDGTIITVDPA